jgi:DNA-binding NarL/FixJ family response regulator
MKAAQQTWRVLLVDPHPLIRDGLCLAFRRAWPAARLEQAGSAPEALEKYLTHRPHLITLDVNLAGLSGLELARQIHAQDTQVRILMFAEKSDPWTVREALAAGMSGFVHKMEAVGCLTEAVQAAMNGRQFLCPLSRATLERAGAEAALEQPPGPAILSPRETEVLRFLADGENTKGIGARLRISPKTVETHRQHIMRKLHLDNVASLTRYAIRHGLHQP